MAAAATGSPSCPPPKPPDPGRSWAEVVGKKQQGDIDTKTPTIYKGEPAIMFTDEEIQILADPFQYALIGKFPRGRPSMETIRKFFAKLNLVADYKIGLMDSNHILIHLHGKDDYHRIWLRNQWNIFQFPMTITKWHINFTPENESPIVPVWISMPYLPAHLFNEKAIESIARIAGKPMRVDASTATLNRPSKARVCVEVDLSKQLPQRGWVGQGSQGGFWQKFIYEELPKYCNECKKVGHEDQSCIMGTHTHKTENETATATTNNTTEDHTQNKVDTQNNKSKMKQVYVAKATKPNNQEDQVEEIKVTETPSNSAEVSPSENAGEEVAKSITPRKDPAVDNTERNQRLTKSMDTLAEDRIRREVMDIHNKCTEHVYVSEGEEIEGERLTMEEMGDFTRKLQESEEETEINPTVNIQGKEFEVVTNRKKRQYLKNPELQRVTRAVNNKSEHQQSMKESNISANE